MRNYANAAKKDIIYPELSYIITGLCFHTHKELGRYCNEKQYGDMIESLLKEKSISHKREYNVPPSFAGEHQMRNKVDFLIEDKIVLELKAKPFVTQEDYYQARRYLHTLGKKLALVVNFRRNYIVPKRILNSGVEADSHHSHTFTH